MKTLLLLTFLLDVLLLSNACSKEPNDEFSFTYNGNNYYNTFDDLKLGVISKKIDQIYFSMPDVFGGDIYFDIRNCAYLVPEFPGSYVGPNCTLLLIDIDATPIDSSKVFTYQSGSLNLSISHCKTHKVEDPFSIWSFEYTTCKASGTFDLTLVNKNNETIEITNGIINNYVIDL